MILQNKSGLSIAVNKVTIPPVEWPMPIMGWLYLDSSSDINSFTSESSFPS